MTGDRALVASPVMTANARLTRAELRKVATTFAFVAALPLAAALAVISVVADTAVTGKNGARQDCERPTESDLTRSV